MNEQILSKVPLASVEQLEGLWRPLSAEELGRAEAQLLQASNYLRQVAHNNGIDLDSRVATENDPEGIYAENLANVICLAVQRVMAAPIDAPPDISQWSQSASPYSESMSFAGGSGGSLFFKTNELKMLGLASVAGQSTIGVIRGVYSENEEE